jgi:hypothetical protein
MDDDQEGTMPTDDRDVPSAAWTGPTSRSATPATPSSSTEPPSDQEPATAPMARPEPRSKRGWFRRSWNVWRWLVFAVPAVVLAIGIGIGVAIQSGEVDRLEDEKAALQETVNDREAQRRSDEAEARRIEQERQRRAEQEQQRQAAEEQQRQQAEQQRQAEEQQRLQQEQQRQQEEQQREAARQNTLPGDGLFAIGTDIRPGRFRTGGPGGGNPVGCYYAILNSPDTSDIATNNITEGPAIVDLPAGKFFDTKSCQQWQRI